MVKAVHDNVVLRKNDNLNSKGIYMPKIGDDSFIVINIATDVSVIHVGQKVILNDAPKKYVDENNVEYFITNIKNIIAIVED